MSDLTFFDLTPTVYPSYDAESDPLGLIAYRTHKRRLGVLGESKANNLETIDEVLTPSQRIKRKLIMRRLAPRLARARKLALRRRGGNDVLKRRAKALARRNLAKKLLGGRNKANVSPSEKARVEKILAKRGKAIERAAVKLLPIVRKAQAGRFNKRKPEPKPEPKPAPSNSNNK